MGRSPQSSLGDAPRTGRGRLGYWEQDNLSKALCDSDKLSKCHLTLFSLWVTILVYFLWLRSYFPHGNGGVSRLAEVRLQDGESLENALRRFKRKVQQEDIIKEIKKHSFYLKPGEKKRVKAALARKRARKKARHEQD